MGCQLSFHVASNSAFFPFTFLFNIFSHFMQIIVLTSTLALKVRGGGGGGAPRTYTKLRP
ncbi:hypothetical protein HanXRQr2_Chr15g0688731 [Helianthus annuus]|uniref:Uncharacterized protein n=1 Tax=Helianthus annuus TaxID=4232 RepID=A0A9K3H2P1_HELAN|nr:hypothetical protein HanXRQr2_Chr15g0688731 [Helianthus annuus]